jgi:DNA-binding MarR family transcriptional regulator
MMMKEQQQERLLHAIRMVIRLSRIAQQVCEKAGITLPQYRAISSLAYRKRRAHEIASHTAVSRPAVTALMTGLEKMGLIEREVDEFDKRGVHFIASTKMKKVLAEVERDLVRRFGEVLGDSAKSLAALTGTEAIEEALDRQAEREFGAPDTVLIDKNGSRKQRTAARLRATAAGTRSRASRARARQRAS